MTSTPVAAPGENSFHSPEADKAQRSAPQPSDQIATSRAIELLCQTRPWVRMFSMLGFTVIALTLLIGLIKIIGSAQMIARGHNGDEAFGIVVRLVAAAAAGLIYFFPSLFLWRYANRIRDCEVTRSVTDMESALEAQRSFWRFAGIAMILWIAFVVVVTAFSGLLLIGTATFHG